MATRTNPALRIRNTIARRTKSGITRKELSQSIGIPHQRVSEYVRDLIVTGQVRDSGLRRERASVLYPTWQG